MQIRTFEAADAASVRDLFIRVNRQLAPRGMEDVFEAYIARSLNEEVDRVAEYYRERNGGFWVAIADLRLAGMSGLEPSGDDGMELRRMYVDPELRRRGVARRMLEFAEQECRWRGRPRMDLSTSALQSAALALYRAAGYTLVKDEIAEASSNKTLGGGIRRYHFSKNLLRRGSPPA